MRLWVHDTADLHESRPPSHKKKMSLSRGAMRRPSSLVAPSRADITPPSNFDITNWLGGGLRSPGRLDDSCNSSVSIMMATVDLLHSPTNSRFNAEFFTSLAIPVELAGSGQSLTYCRTNCAAKLSQYSVVSGAHLSRPLLPRNDTSMVSTMSVSSTCGWWPISERWQANSSPRSLRTSDQRAWNNALLMRSSGEAPFWAITCRMEFIRPVWNTRSLKLWEGWIIYRHVCLTLWFELYGLGFMV